MATANPAMSEAVWQRAGAAETPTRVMTIQGTALKTALLTLILLATATFAWTKAAAGSQLSYGLLLGGGIGGFIVAMVTIFAPKVSPFTGPIYAALQGLLLGSISVAFETVYPGIVIQAVGLSVGVLAVMLFLYGTRIIRVTRKLAIGIIAATGAIFLVYLVDIVISFFGRRVPFVHEGGAWGIGFSVLVVGIAAFNLLLDFDFIEKGVQQQAPRFMEWYGGFSLMVTLIWMYLEILRLLAKIRGNR
jgi:uncharacterized YccA/Bax inhibitor family protein